MIDLAPFHRRSQAQHHTPPTPVRILQYQWEFDELLKLYREKAPRVVLEIGNGDGGTLYHWLYNAGRDVLVIALDLDKKDAATFGAWAGIFANLKIITADSRSDSTVEQVKQAAPTGLNWLFIDGGHDYATARSDFEKYGALVNPGGIVAFHDIKPHHASEVGRLWREIQQAGYVTRELIAAPNDGGGAGIGVVYL